MSAHDKACDSKMVDSSRVLTSVIKIGCSSVKRGLSEYSFLYVPLVVYIVSTCVIAARLSLWVDEILQLIGTRDAANWRELSAWIAINPGGVPFGYLTQRLAMSLLGHSELAARVPSILFSTLSCVGVAILARQLGYCTRRAGMAALLLAVLPLQLRYATEARPYSQALFFSVCSSVAFAYLVRKPTLGRTVVYTSILVLTVYTQPFGLFVAIGHLLWLAVVKRQRYQVRLFICCVSGIAIASMAFCPWLLWVASKWKNSVRDSDTVPITARTLLVIVREVPGSYVLAALLVLTCVYALGRKDRKDTQTKLLLLATVLVPVLCAMSADAVFGYFFAVRQVIFILPSIAIFAADGSVNVISQRRSWGYVLTVALIAGAFIQDVRMLGRPRENWALAADEALKESASGCVAVVPRQWAPLYAFFQPSLASVLCSETFASGERVVSVLTPYTDRNMVKEFDRSMSLGGFSPEGPSHSVGGSTIRVFVR